MENSNQYLTPESPEAFLDFEMMPPPKYFPEHTKLCPVCKGHGGWNLRTFAYRLPKGLEDTAENRHKHVHFRAGCSHCNGWGYVDKNEDCPKHEWVFVRNLGRCYNLHKCKHCGKEWDIDSSD